MVSIPKGLFDEVESFAQSIIGKGMDLIGQTRSRRALAASSSSVPKLTNQEKRSIVEKISKWFECSLQHQVNELCDHKDCTLLLKESQAYTGSCKK